LWNGTLFSSKKHFKLILVFVVVSIPLLLISMGLKKNFFPFIQDNSVHPVITCQEWLKQNSSGEVSFVAEQLLFLIEHGYLINGDM
jgi:ABC-type phosphate transport system permease subunit